MVIFLEVTERALKRGIPPYKTTAKIDKYCAIT